MENESEPVETKTIRLVDKDEDLHPAKSISVSPGKVSKKEKTREKSKLRKRSISQESENNPSPKKRKKEKKPKKEKKAERKGKSEKGEKKIKKKGREGKKRRINKDSSKSPRLVLIFWCDKMNFFKLDFDFKLRILIKKWKTAKFLQSFQNHCILFYLDPLFQINSLI